MKGTEKKKERSQNLSQASSVGLNPKVFSVEDGEVECMGVGLGCGGRQEEDHK